MEFDGIFCRKIIINCAHAQERVVYCVYDVKNSTGSLARLVDSCKLLHAFDRFKRIINKRDGKLLLLRIVVSEKPGSGRGCTPLYGLYRYVPRDRVWFLEVLDP